MQYHDKELCKGQFCCIHNPSKHHMVKWPLSLRETGLMERKCSHGVGHPDPDSVAYFESRESPRNKGTWGIHGCDGCCAAPKTAPALDPE